MFILLVNQQILTSIPNYELEKFLCFTLKWEDQPKFYTHNVFHLKFTRLAPSSAWNRKKKEILNNYMI